MVEPIALAVQISNDAEDALNAARNGFLDVADAATTADAAIDGYDNEIADTETVTTTAAASNANYRAGLQGITTGFGAAAVASGSFTAALKQTGRQLLALARNPVVITLAVLAAALYTTVRAGGTLFNLFDTRDKVINRAAVSFSLTGEALDKARGRAIDYANALQFRTLRALGETSSAAAVLFQQSLTQPDRNFAEELARDIEKAGSASYAAALEFATFLQAGEPTQEQFSQIAASLGLFDHQLRDLIAQGLPEFQAALKASNETQSSFEKSTQELGDAWDGLQKVLAPIGEAILTPLFNSLTGIITFLTNINWDNIRDAFKNAFDAIGDAARVWVAEFRDRGEQVWNNLKDGLDTTWTTLRDRFTGIYTALSNTASTWVMGFVDIGKAVINNIKDGIVSAWSSAKDFVAGLFTGVGDTVKTALRDVGILGSSPAPVGLKIGQDIKDGITASLSTPVDINPQISAGATGIVTRSSAPRPAQRALDINLGGHHIKRVFIGMIEDELAFLPQTAGL